MEDALDKDAAKNVNDQTGSVAIVMTERGPIVMDTKACSALGTCLDTYYDDSVCDLRMEAIVACRR